MKSRKTALGIAALLSALGILFAVWLVWRGPPPQQLERGPVVQAQDYKLSGPYTHANLTIFLIHGSDTLSGKTYLTLQEALERQQVVVHETGEVNALAIENLSPTDEVYIQSGDIVKGGQQDRVLAYDLILPPQSGKVPLASFCVEHGRWRQRGGESLHMFDSSGSMTCSKDLKLAAKYQKDQTTVWAEVAKTQKQLSDNLKTPVTSAESASSLQLTLENANVRSSTEKYLGELSAIVAGKEDAIGYAFAINGKVNSADVYGSSALFKKLWPKLLQSSTVEAVAALQPDAKFEPVGAESVQQFLVEAEKGKTSSQPVSERVHVIVQEQDKTVRFDTCDRAREGRPVHSNYLAK